MGCEYLGWLCAHTLFLSLSLSIHCNFYARGNSTEQRVNTIGDAVRCNCTRSVNTTRHPPDRSLPVSPPTTRPRPSLPLNVTRFRPALINTRAKNSPSHHAKTGHVQRTLIKSLYCRWSYGDFTAYARTIRSHSRDLQNVTKTGFYFNNYRRRKVKAFFARVCWFFFLFIH